MELAGQRVAVPPLRRRTLLGAAAAATLACLDGCADRPDYPSGPLRIASGGTGGVYYAYAQGIAAVIRDALPGLRPEVLATAASVQNLQMVATGRAELGLTTADAAADAHAGGPPFPQRLPVLALCRIYENYVQLAVRRDRDIHRLADLRGKAVSIGPPGSGTELVTARLLPLAGLDVAADLHPAGLDPDVAAEAVRSGRLDGMFFSGGIPTAAIDGLARQVPVELIDLGGYLPAMRERYGEVYVERTIPGSTYGLGKPAVTFGVANYLVVPASMDERVGYWVTRALFEHREELAAAHPMGTRLDRTAAISTYPLDLHPGAARYFRDAKR
jgi:TRAP transporter TAXI family solute receptor